IITYSYVSRILEADGIGRISFAKSIIGIFAMISMLGIRYYGIRECAKRRDDRRELSRIFSELLVLNLIFTFFAYVFLAVFLCLSAKADGYRTEIGLYGITILLSVLSIEWMFVAVEDYRYLAVRSIVIQFASLLAVFLLVHRKEDLSLYILIQVISAGLANLSGLMYVKKYTGFQMPRLSGLCVHMRPILSLFLVTMFIQIFTEMDTVMLGYLSDDTEVGLYSSAYKISAVLCSFISAVTTVILPRMAYVLQNEDETKAHDLLKKAVQFILMVGIPISAGSCIFSRNFVLILSGKGFINAVPSAMILSFRTLLSPVNGMLLMHYLIPRNKEREAIIITMVTALFNIIVNMALIPLLGARGAAISTVCSEITEMICLFVFVRKYLDMKNIFGKGYQYLLCVIPVVIVSLGAAGLIDSIFLSVVVAVTVSVPVYFILLYRMRNACLLDGLNMIRELRKKKRA
ncbi:MAG: flippase, partial [Lachnospiraceae bacterium]|nr:flippase [Lachnospiraceae bacterium]